MTSHDVCKRSVEYEEQSLMAVWMRMLTSGSVCGRRHGTTLTSWSDRGKVKSNTSVSLNNQSCKCVGYLFQISPMCLCCSLPSCNIANVSTLYFILLCLWILAFSVTGFSNLFTGSALNALDFYMRYTAEVVTLHKYIVWFTFV